MDFQWQYNPLVIPLSFSTLLVIVLIGLGLHRRKSPVARSYLFFMLCILIWIAASLLELVTLNLRLSLFAADLSFLGITFFPVAWLSMVVAYTGQQQRWRRLLPWLFVFPVLTNIIIWTNPLHHLWRGNSYRDLTTTWFPISIYEYGPWFYWVYMPLALVIIFAALFLLLRAIYTHKGAYRPQMLIMLIAFGLMLGVELLHQLGLDPLPHYNSTTLIFPISGFLVAWALFRFRFLDLMPIARDLLVENMRDLMIVLDNQGRVVDLNPAARQHFLWEDSVIIGKDFGSLLSDLGKERKWFTEDTQRLDEVEIWRNGECRIYEIRVSPIRNSLYKKRGSFLLLYDITKRKEAEQIIHDQVRQVAVLEERQRLARELHDSVNQTLFAARTLADLLPRAIAKKPEKIPEYAHNIQQLIHGATAEMRLVLLELYPDALTQTDLGTIIKYLCQAHTGTTGTPVDFSAAMQIYLDPDTQIAFYRIAREALHNISKYAEATTISVSLTGSYDIVELVIQDDGLGFDPADIPPDHFGLSNMVARAKAVGAELAIVSSINQGTTITVSREDL